MSKDPILFQTISWIGCDYEEDDTWLYGIKTFGRTLNGESVSVTIKNFKPYFYVKLDDESNTANMRQLMQYKLPSRMENEFNKAERIKSKDFWGFSNNEEFSFIKFSFNTERAMKEFIRILSKAKKYKFYEHNIDPYIKFIHGNNLQPNGWVVINRYNACDDLQSISEIDIECDYKVFQPYKCDNSAPFLVASFDLECMSFNGDFPLPKKDYTKLSGQLFDFYSDYLSRFNMSDKERYIHDAIMFAFGYLSDDQSLKIFKPYIGKVDPKIIISKEVLSSSINKEMDNILYALTKSGNSIDSKKDTSISKLIILFEKMNFPGLKGDKIIQIGTTFHKYGNKELEKYIYTLGTCDPIEGATVESFSTEKDLILKWKDLIQLKNPDIITGYNILGFDFWYIYARALDLKIEQSFMKIGRLKNKKCTYEERKLSSSALGDNILKFIDMDGRVIIDIMKVVQRDHKLDSYKLDNVANHFIGLNKNDVTPQDIFRLQKGDSNDRRIIAEYCLQDCALCNQIMIKLEIIANNIGMSNVCLVPLSYIFMRGQGIKIFSLILYEANKNGYLIPVKKYNEEDEIDDTYEGAIVLEPEEGIYIDEPVCVLDYASLYPSSMISENLSHDKMVIDEKYNNIPGVEYLDITFDIFDGDKNKIGVHTSRFVQSEKGIIPNILDKLLKARKSTRKNINMKNVILNNGTEYKGLVIEKEEVIIVNDISINKNEIEEINDLYSDFQKSVLDGLQNAYKITSNSLYGQMGAKTSQVYLKEIAACTTATGRKMILMAKEFLEKNYNANIIYGDTDSIFCIFPREEKGNDAIMPSIIEATKASNEFKKLIKPPHDLEYEKTFWPFILLSKKRYVGNVYEHDDKNFKQKSMGIVLKRRDNAHIVKTIYGGIIDIILNKQDVDESVIFLKKSLQDITNGNVDMKELIITKSLRDKYKDPTRIAHKVLADRIRDRDPGNAPQSNDRIQYAYIVNKNAKCLQGDRIETPEFIKKNNIKIDYQFYITNQILKPVLQVYGMVIEKLDKNEKNYKEIYKKLLESYEKDVAKEKYMTLREEDAKRILFGETLRKVVNNKNNQSEITQFYKSSDVPNVLSKMNKKDFKPGDDLDIKLLNSIRKKKVEKSIKTNENSIMKFVKQVS